MMTTTMNKDKQEFWEALSYPDLRDRTCQTCANSDKSGGGKPCHKTDAFEDCFADYNSYPKSNRDIGFLVQKNTKSIKR